MQGSKLRLQARVASTNATGRLHFVIDGKSQPALKVPNTGGEQTWTTIDSGKTIELPRNSIHTVRLVCDAGGFNINYWQYQAEIPFAKTISLQSKVNNKWVTASDTGALQPSAAKVAAPQRFQLIDESAAYWHGVVALQSVMTHRYVTADPAAKSPMTAQASAVGPAELFQWIDNGDGTISLRSMANYLTVSATSSEPTSLINTNIIPGLSESFVLRSK